MTDCFKCKSPAKYKHKNALPVCADCFNSHLMVRGLRAFLRNELQTFGRENLFYAYFDGGVESAALVYLLAAARNPFLKKRIFFDFHIVVPRRFWHANGDGDLWARAEKLGAAVGASPLRCEIAENEREAIEWKAIGDSVAERGGFREEFYDILIGEALRKFGAEKKILFGECADRGATRALSLLCTGRQDRVLRECSPVWKHNTTLFARPLLSFTARDIAYYAHLNRLSAFVLPRPSVSSNMASLPGEGSVERLIAEFVAGLQTSNHAAATAVLRVVDKLEPATCSIAQIDPFKLRAALAGTPESDHCALCDASAAAGLCRACSTMFGLEARQSDS